MLVLFVRHKNTLGCLYVTGVYVYSLEYNVVLSALALILDCYWFLLGRYQDFLVGREIIVT